MKKKKIYIYIYTYKKLPEPSPKTKQIIAENRRKKHNGGQKILK